MTHTNSDRSFQAILQLGIPDYVPQVLQLYQGALAEVEFPGINREVLDDLVQQVDLKSRDLERLQQQVDEAKKELELSKESLSGAARRGLAYARIYGESDVEVAEIVERIKFDDQLKAGTKSKTRSPRKKQQKAAIPQFDEESGNREQHEVNESIDVNSVDSPLQTLLSA